ncbi:MAG: DciA family protein [Candidatus Omnitrophota bacterium]|nr:DciA family protein [Candidatus Omnitrophota bacterium]
MEKIKDTIEVVIRDLLVKKSGSSNNAPESWLRKVLTKKELGHIKLQYFRKGILGLSVDSSPWLYSLNLKKARLLGELQRCSPDIQEIRFHIGDVQ